MLQQLLIVCPLVFFAGFVDSIAGGGGIISLPAYYAAGLSPRMALGTNKFAASCGTSVATFRFMKQGKVNYPLAAAAVVMALIGAFFGAQLAQVIDENVLRGVLVIALPVITVFVLRNKKFSKDGFEVPLPLPRALCVSGLAGLVIGCYDGFFGPGTGTFLIIIFNTVLGLDILTSSGNAKIINLASNVSSLVSFILGGYVLYKLAIPAAIFGIMGNYVGAGMALKKGMRMIRPVMVLVMGLLLCKVVVDLISGL